MYEKDLYGMAYLRKIGKREGQSLDAAYQPLREELASAGLDEETLRKMDPDDRVAALEKARLDPYDFIYLAC